MSKKKPVPEHLFLTGFPENWSGTMGRSEPSYDRDEMPSWTPGRVTVKKTEKNPGKPGGTISWETKELLKNEEDVISRNDQDRLLRDEGLDPAEWDVITHTVSHWVVVVKNAEGQPEEVPAEGRKLTVRKREIKKILNLTPILDKVFERYLREPKVKVSRQTGDILVVPVGDLQIGKADGGGTPAIMDRFCRLTEEIAADIKANGKLEGLVLPWLGDCIEGEVSQNGKLVTRLDVTPDAQVEVYVRMLTHQILTMAPLARKVLIPIIPGNHDETGRHVSKPHTSSWAITGGRITQTFLETFAGKDFEHVSFLYPQYNEPTVAADIGPEGTPLIFAFTHGHIVGTNPNQVKNWWAGQALGEQQAGHAKILLSAHWHHLRAEAMGADRSWFQIPALDGGSDWFRQKKGDDPSAGMMSFYATPGQVPFWRNMNIYS